MIALLIAISAIALAVASVAVSSDRWDDIKLRLHELWLYVQLYFGTWRNK